MRYCRSPLHWWVYISIMQTLSSMALLRKTFPNFSKCKISWCMSYLIPTNPNFHTLLQQLHWLLTEYTINCKIANITFNTLHYSRPAYLHSYLCFHSFARSLRSSSTNLLTILPLCLHAQHYALVASLLRLLTFGTFCLQLCISATVLKLSAGASKIITSGKPFSSP